MPKGREDSQTGPRFPDDAHQVLRSGIHAARERPPCPLNISPALWYLDLARRDRRDHPNRPLHRMTEPSSGITPPFTLPKLVEKPWGREIWWAHEDRYAGKVLIVNRGHVLSLQKHEVKKETLYLQSGRVIFHLNGTDYTMEAGSSITVNPGDVHRMEALEDVVFLEVSTPELDDVIRLEDRYGRV